ncbi:MAG: hypothetical protein HYV63_34370 [Candidatus Schekmanbacteria bacterium]|nr:hypothetical protein [Candidatus Schekmanbacteria bacterium]
MNKISKEIPSILLLALIISVLSCSGEGSEATRADSAFDTINSSIFQARCALSGCHGQNPSAGLSLASGNAYDNLVNQRSSQVPALFRVAPGDAASSYLIHKLRGTAGSVGGEASQMPLDGTPLSEADIAAIEAWIDNGAER